MEDENNKIVENTNKYSIDSVKFYVAIILILTLQCVILIQVINTHEVINSITYDTNISKTDIYNSGFCERLNLVSAVYVQYDANANVYYGVPICLEKADNNI